MRRVGFALYKKEIRTNRMKGLIFWLLILPLLWLGGSCACFATEADSAQTLMTRAENSLDGSKCFAVEYTAQPEHNARWPGVMLQGKFVVQNEHRCFLTNNGGISIVPAVLTLVSDEQSHLIVHYRGFDWFPDQPSEIAFHDCAGVLIRGGVVPLIVSVVANVERHLTVDNEQKVRLNLLSVSTWKVSDLKVVGKDQILKRPANHLSFTSIAGTNQPEQVDLWLDEASGLPVKRMYKSRDTGDLMTETYSFKLNPKLTPDFFNPRRVAGEMKLGRQIVAAEKPAAMLLHAALWGDDDGVDKALKRGADVNSRTAAWTGRPGPRLSALMVASIRGELGIVKRLMRAGAEINAIAPSGATALDFAIVYHHTEVADWLKSQGAKLGKHHP